MATIAAPAPQVEHVGARPPRPAALWALTVAGVAAGSSALVFALTNDGIGTELGEPLVIALLSNWITLSYVFCGLIAWWRRPESRFGPLMLVAGFTNYLATLSWTTNDLAFTVGQAADLLPPVIFLHVFLAFPSGRLETRFERVLVGSAYAVALGLQLVRMSFGGFGPHNLLEVSPNVDVTVAATRVQLLLVSAACLAGVAILATRRRRSGRPLRRSLALLVDAFALGLVMIAFLFVSLVVDGPAVPQIRWATFVTLGLAPLAFLVGLLHARLARSSVGDLFVELRSDPAPAELQTAIARALRDPSATLAYWLPEFRRYADLEARPVELPDEHGRQATTLIDRDGAHVAALVHDRSLLDEPELLAAVTSAAAIAIENARLHVDLRARLEELRGSRARIVEAGLKERQRLERNLHDGAQQRLVALSLELRLLEERVDGDPETRRRLDLARREIGSSLAELRELARGLHPAVVTGHGLEVALESLAARAPVPVTLTVATGGRLPDATEVAVYYLVAECLTNIGKYAEADWASVDVSQEDGVVVVEVVDDGVGGADTEGGTGLRGLADRVETLDGRLRIWSPVGGGTRVRAEIPCAP
jgi:signal transduction histidine kinase